MYTVGSAIILAPHILAKVTEQDAWLSVIIGGLIGLLPALLFHWIGQQLKEEDFFGMIQTVFGRVVGKMVIFLYVSFFIFLSALLLREIGDFISAIILVSTPRYVTNLLMFLIICMGVFYGIEVVARAAEVLFPWIIILFLPMFIFLIPEFQWDYLLPVLKNGFSPVFEGAFLYFTFPLELITLVVLYPIINKHKQIKKTFLFGLLIGTGLILIVTLYSILVLGPDLSSRNLYPTFTLAKKVNVANFFQRLEVFMAGVWIITIYVKLAVTFYVSAIGIAKLTSLEDYRKILLGLGAVLLALAEFISPDTSAFYDFATGPASILISIYGLMIPIIIAIIMKIGKRKKEKGK